MGSGNNNSVQVNIYGKQYYIAGDASRGEILRYAKYVDQKMEALLRGRKHSITTDIMTLTAINIAEDLFDMKAERDEVLAMLGEKEKEIEGYNKLWDDAKSGFSNARQEYEGAKEALSGLEEDYQAAKEAAEQYQKENNLLKKEAEALRRQIAELKEMHVQMQMYLPEENQEEKEYRREPAARVTGRPTAYNKKKKKNRHKKKRSR